MMFLKLHTFGENLIGSNLKTRSKNQLVFITILVYNIFYILLKTSVSMQQQELKV
jgi:hypothetical protein